MSKLTSGNVLLWALKRWSTGSGSRSLRGLSTSSQRMRDLKVDNLLIIGGGLMGSGIAQSCATSGRFESIVLQDVSQEALEKAKSKMMTNLGRMKKRDASIDEEKVVGRITFSTKIEPKSDRNLLIIEAIPELLKPKQSVFNDLSQRFWNKESVILASNTSSLPCRDIGTHVKSLNRFAGLHFFNPVPLMKLVEVVRLENGTDESTHRALVQFVKDIGKVPVECKDTPGFIVNRLLFPYLFDALEMLERGDASAHDIDNAMKFGAGYPMGPFELLDYVGLDTAMFIASSLLRKDGSQICKDSPLLSEMVKKGHLGKKSGQGFYNYES